MKTTRYILIILSVLFTFIFLNGICTAQTAGKTKQEKKAEIPSDVQNIEVSEKYLRNVKSLLRKQKAKWNEDQIQCAALYWQTAEKTAKTGLDNDFVLLFTGIINKSNKPKTAKELAEEVVHRCGEVTRSCTENLKKIENDLNLLRPQYEMYKKLEEIKIQARSSSSSKSLSASHASIESSLNDPERDKKIEIMDKYNATMNQYKEVTLQHKRCTVYTSFAKKIQIAFDSSK
ncbi:MAG: hypothetical protein LBK82_02515 [Planctomycetaceae bacterium]|jgi:hypothetical protein|nr:hypothetical protein [Planctomycetaceae bacterium]